MGVGTNLFSDDKNMGFLNFLVSIQWDFKAFPGEGIWPNRSGADFAGSTGWPKSSSFPRALSYFLWFCWLLFNQLFKTQLRDFPSISKSLRLCEKKSNRSGKGAQGRPLTGMSLTGGVGWDVPGLGGRGRFGEWAINWFSCILGPRCHFQRGSDEHLRQIWRQGSEGIRKDLFSFFLEWDESGEGEASKECYGKELIISYLFQWPCLF